VCFVNKGRAAYLNLSEYTKDHKFELQRNESDLNCYSAMTISSLSGRRPTDHYVFPIFYYIV